MLEDPQPKPDFVEQLSRRLLEVLFTYGPRVIGALLFLLAAWLVSEWVRRLILRAMTRAGADVTLTKFFANLARWSVLVLSVVGCLGIFDVQTTSYAAVVGSAGLALGLAMQGSLSHLAAGVLLLIFRPFRVGDVVSVAGQSGIVDEIELFSTRLDTPDNRRIIIPNGQVFGAIIENVSHHPHRRVDVSVQTDLASDIDVAKQALLDAARSVEARLTDRPCDAALLRVGTLGAEWNVSVWAEKARFATAREQLIIAIQRSLRAASVAIPVLPNQAMRTPVPKA